MTNQKFSSTRDTARVSLIETSDIVNGDITVHAVDWWNGGGIDVSIKTKSVSGEIEERSLSVSDQELQNIFTLAIVHGMIDVELAVKDSKKMLERAEVVKQATARVFDKS